MEITSIKAIFIFLIIMAVNAVLTRILLRHVSPFMLARGIYGYDVNKPARSKVPEEGGVSIAIALVFSLVLYGYFFNLAWVGLLAITTALISLIGFVDRLRDIRPYPKFIYCAVVGSVYSISFFQDPHLSIYYAIAFLFLGSVLYSVLVNSFNLLAGFNGLESGLAVIASFALALFFGIKGYYAAAGVALLQMTGFLVFWPFNRFPARVFLGDSGSLIPGSVFFGLALLTRQWVAIVFVMAPHLLNILIKFFSTGVSSKSDFEPLVYKEGILQLPQKNYWSLIRLYLATGPKSEKSIVYFVLSLEALFCSLLFVFCS